jgi:aspartyl-tRNA(Asn)/glutamyl-tRNA(Gln) amidotransferase subunit B
LRLSRDYELSAYDGDVLVNQGRAVVDYFLAVADATDDPKAACNWVTQQVLRELKDRGQSIDQFGVSAAALAGLIAAINDGRLPSPRASEAFQLMLAKGCDVEATLAELKIARVDESELILLVQELLAANPKTVADIRAGKHQAAGALIGQAKKKNPNVDPNRVRELALELAQQPDA